MKKTSFLVIILFMTTLSFTAVKYVKSFNNPESVTNDINTEEVLLTEDLEPNVVKVNDTNDTVITGINVPYYWKTGINIDTNDYLKGTIPTIKSFKEYYKTYNNVMYGTYTKHSYTIDNIESLINKDNIIYSNGIANATDYFSWNNDCVSNYSSTLNTTLFYCYNWVNWLGISDNSKTFSLTKCSIDGVNGYCVFEDYVNVYYSIKKTSETRCFGDDLGSYYCNYEDYSSLIEYIN